MAETPESRVNARAEQIRQYKDKQGIARTDSLNQKQMDEAMHREITGNNPPGAIEQPPQRPARSRPMMEQIQTAAAEQGAVPIGEAIKQRLAQDGIQGVTVAPEQSFSISPNQSSTAPASTVSPPPQSGYVVPAQQPQVQATGGGVFATEPPPVRQAAPIEEPGTGKAALAMLGALLPGVGGFLMEPFAKAQRNYMQKTEKDVKLTDMFWKEFDEDPVNAKRFARVPVVRDALQRRYGMSADEIIDLDKSIGQSSALKAKDIFYLAEKGLVNLPPSIDTEIGQVTTRPVTQTIGGLPYKLNQQTNQYELMQTEVMKMYDDAVKGYQGQGYSPDEASLMAMKATKGQPIFNSTEVGNGVVIMRNDALGTVHKFKFTDAVKEKNRVEIVKNELTKEPIGAFFYREGEMPTSPEDVMFLSFASMQDSQGRNVAQLIRGMSEEEAKSPGKIARFISWLFGGTEVTDHSKLLEGQGGEPGTGGAQGAQQVNPVPGPITPPPPEVPPVNPQVNTTENKKVNQLLLDTGAI